MTIADLLKPSQFVIGPDGQLAAVQISVENWRALIEQLDDLEDRAAVRATLGRLRSHPVQSDAINWEQARDQWLADAENE